MVIKTCGNCYHESKTSNQYPCINCLKTDDLSYWKAEEDDAQV